MPSPVPLIALVLAAPVPGEVTREFVTGPDPFAAGQHRGADFAAAPGAPVRASCPGEVAFAGRAGSSGGVVSLRCGGFRVTHLPLARIVVRAGARVRRGAVLGAVGRSGEHEGVHLGVRTEGSRFGYVDPLRFLAQPATTPPPLGPAPRVVWPPRAAPPPRVVRPPRAAPPPRVFPPPSRASTPRASSPLAPWPAWAGLALVLAGAGLGSQRRRTKRRRARLEPGRRPPQAVASSRP